ncbi:MAG: YggS family pyridoxal phosphate-dependent enzyme [Peptoniphilaceae bacterium]
MSIKDNLYEVLEDINKARKISITNEEVNLIAVSKTYEVEKIIDLYKLGIKNFGENKVQELKDKIEKVPEDLNFHMIGNFQTNKVKYIYDKVELIQSIDRIKLLKEINKRAKKDNIIVNGLIQVNIGNEPQKGGVDPLSLNQFIEDSLKFENVKIKGLMAIAPLTNDEKVIRNCFKKMFKLKEDIISRNYKEVDMKYLSMGMSQDYKIAIEEGSNMVRIGSKIFGNRVYK